MAGTREWALEHDGWCRGQMICLRALLESGDGSGASLIAQSVKNMPAVRETQVHIPVLGRAPNFMAAVTICGDFKAQEEEICHYFHLFPIC